MEHSGNFLSQFYPATFTDAGNTFTSAEMYMMYEKAVLFGDNDMAKRILEAKTPLQAKRLGRRVKGFDQETWNQHRERIVHEGNWLKFQSNRSLLDKFMMFPRGTQFIEASPTDRIWGIGFSARDAPNNRSRWGLNLLGKTLTAIRNVFD